jgi:hypothetical protein
MGQGVAAAMGATRTFRHKDYELICTATAVDGGKFVPAIVVARQIWPSRPRNIAIPRGDYSTEESALDAAQAQGMEWVVNYG